MKTKMKWHDGTEAEVQHPPSWIEWLIKNSTLYQFGYATHPLPEKPFHLACIEPDQVKILAMQELEALRNMGAGI